MATATVHTMIAKTLRNRALMANALCAVAEGEAQSGRLIGAAETIRSVRLMLADIDILLSGDTSYLPYGSLREVSELLAGLSDRIDTVERSMGAQTIH